jgi:anti-sigma B factor antagonist
MPGPHELILCDEAIDDSTSVVSPSGKIDAINAPQLGRCLLRLGEAGARRIVVDLSGVSLMDSIGLGVLLNALRRVSLRRGSLVLVAPHERIRRPFEISGLKSQLRLFDSREAALHALPSTP